MKPCLAPLFRRALLAALVGLCLAPASRAEPVKCRCPEGKACYHFLNAPVSPPDDPCSCPFCREHPGQCPKRLPEGWDPDCADSRRMECFLRRHAASWDLACSEQLAGTCDCKNPHPEWCPRCGVKGRAWNAKTLAAVAGQVKFEQGFLGPRSKFVLIQSPHFYLLTDIRGVKIHTQKNTYRVMTTHEIAHQFIQRAEQAYDDFVRYFDNRVILNRPCAIYLMDREATKQKIAEVAFGHPDPELFYGGEAKRIAGGYAFNGIAISKQKYDTDNWLHFQMRHLLGHILLSCWIKVEPRVDYFPRWAYVGVGHWLSRLPVKFREMANFCAGEGFVVSDDGEKWRQDLLRYAVGSRAYPIQKIFDVEGIGGLDLQMHQRAWSWFDLCLSEDRKDFVDFLAWIRDGKDQRQAMLMGMGISPEEFEQRWRDRILGHRPSMAPTVEELDQANPESPAAKQRSEIRNEKDLSTLASRIRALARVDDPLTAATIVPLLRSESDLVRETVVLVLGRTTDPRVRVWLRTEGLMAHGGLVRAYVARILGNLKDPEAAPTLLQFAKDSSWLVRAHVARSLGLLRHEPGLRTLDELASDRASKVSISAMDALALFGERASFAWEHVSENLDSGAWQVRSAAAECLGALGDMRAVEPLVARMEKEVGRIRQDIRAALKRITRDDLGNDPHNWRDWWEREKERNGGNLPPRADERKEPPKGEHNYGEPTYYGFRIYSRGIGYVLDTSASMNYRIKIDPAWIKRNRRDYPADATKFDLAAKEIEASLHSLDPRTRFNLYFFRSAASIWKGKMIPASPDNVDAAVSRLTAERPVGVSYRGQQRTNYIDVFRKVFGIEEGKPPSGSFSDTPDSIYFLTDGLPTVGDITDPEILLQWFSEENRFARIRVFVVTFGLLETNAEFLGPLAERNGGKFVQVPQVN